MQDDAGRVDHAAEARRRLARRGGSAAARRGRPDRGRRRSLRAPRPAPRAPRPPRPHAAAAASARLRSSSSTDGSSRSSIARVSARVVGNVAATATEIRLTELVSCGGCAAKYSAALLQELVGGLAGDADPDLLVGLAPSDDAAVYRLDDERALVFTLDFFPPIVDDPADFGAIAATNALNDVFAMGGRPLARAVGRRLPRVAAGRRRRRGLRRGGRQGARGGRRARGRPHAARGGAALRPRGRRHGLARRESGRRPARARATCSS